MDSALANKESVVSQIDFQLPAEKASAEAALKQAQVELAKTTVYAGVDGWVEQFILRPATSSIRCCGRPASGACRGWPRRNPGRFRADRSPGDPEGDDRRGDLHGDPLCRHPCCGDRGPKCYCLGQVRPTDQLVDPMQAAQPGTITAYLTPLVLGNLIAFRRAATASPTPTPAITTRWRQRISARFTGLHSTRSTRWGSFMLRSFGFRRCCCRCARGPGRRALRLRGNKQSRPEQTPTQYCLTGCVCAFFAAFVAVPARSDARVPLWSSRYERPSTGLMVVTARKLKLAFGLDVLIGVPWKGSPGPPVQQIETKGDAGLWRLSVGDTRVNTPRLGLGPPMRRRPRNFNQEMCRLLNHRRQRG